MNKPRTYAVNVYIEINLAMFESKTVEILEIL